MASYRIVIEKRVYKDLRKIPTDYQKKIWQKISDLADDPRPREAVQLSNRQEWRIKQGIYRILYEIQDKVVEVRVVRVAHRGQAYEQK
jgi:mRNA interferase RelE/StbE